MTNNASAGFDSVVSRSYVSSSATHHCSFSFSARSALAGLALFVLGVSGCGGSASPPPSPTASPTPTIDGSYYYTPVPKPSPAAVSTASPTPRPSPTPLPPPPTATFVPTSTPEPTPTPLPTPTPNWQAIKIKNELDRLRSFPEHPELSTLADTIEATLGVGGYTATEIAMISEIRRWAEEASVYKAPGVLDDFKTILQTKTYTSKTMSVNGRDLEVVILASDPARAPFYFELIQRVIPKVEAFTGLKYSPPTFIIHSQHKNRGVALGGGGSWGISVPYPSGSDGPNTKVVRYYEITTEGKYLEELIAHEYDHSLSNTSEMQDWLTEGKANFTKYHALRSTDGLPTIEEPFPSYRANLETNVGLGFGGIIPPISEYDGNSDSRRRIVLVTDLGELLLNDILVRIGPENMSKIIREINARTSKSEYVDTQTFAGIILKHTPPNLQSQMNKFISERVYGTQTTQP